MKTLKPTIVLLALFAMVVFLLAGFTSPAVAETVNLAWDANTETDLAGYKLHYKTGTTGAPYAGTGAEQGDSPIKIPLAALSDRAAPAYTLTGLTADTYFFAVTAYNTDGGESEYSNEMRVNCKAPEAPKGLRRIIEMIIGYFKSLFGGTGAFAHG